nr:helix-turn-helix domain-containing protein [Kibdelosporangium sp. MJ126-NF4]CEL20313.1 Transcriptional regulator, HxlR family [Kibdelosporangium sp. MJ126-NF4]CTQ97539.1 Transcriptional regulator, HxlR family [Kibdelosporangium sp. MJ126-NF4]
METDLDQQVYQELMDARHDPAHACGVARTLQVLDGKWTTLIVRELLAGPLRFTELRSALDDVSAKTLTDRLRALEHQGILTRTIHAEIPPRVVYELTEQGQSLQVVLHAMLRWGRAHPA